MHAPRVWRLCPMIPEVASYLMGTSAHVEKVLPATSRRLRDPHGGKFSHVAATGHVLLTPSYLAQTTPWAQLFPSACVFCFLFVARFVCRSHFGFRWSHRISHVTGVKAHAYTSSMASMPDDSRSGKLSHGRKRTCRDGPPHAFTTPADSQRGKLSHVAATGQAFSLDAIVPPSGKPRHG